MTVVVIDRPQRLSERSIGLLRSMIGRYIQFNAIKGRIFLRSDFEASGVIIEQFDRGLGPGRRNQAFCYLSARLGREEAETSADVRRLVVLPRLPIGLFGRCYRWRTHRTFAHWSPIGGVQVLKSSGGFSKISRIDVFEEMIFSGEGGASVTPADRRIVFNHEDGEGLAVEADDWGSAPLLITDSDSRPNDRPPQTLKLRSTLAAA